MRILIILVSIAAYFSVSAEENRPLRVGMELSYPPFEMIDKQGNPKGISVDLARALGRYLHREVEIQNIPFIGLIPSLKTNKIDLIISSLTMTPERKKVIDFSEPYIETGLCLLISQKSSLDSIEGADESDRVIVVKQGTTGEVYAQKNLKKATVLILDKEASCVLEIVQGKADAFIYDQFSVFTNWQRNLNTTRVNLHPFYKEYWAVGIRKGNAALLAQVNEFLKQFRQSKGFEELGNLYLPQQKAAFEKLGIPFFL